MTDSSPPMRVPVERVEPLARQILVAVGASESDAARVVDSLVYADRRGVGSHGLLRLKFYVDRVRAGGIDPAAITRVLRDEPAAALLDGGNGFGAVVTTRAMEIATEKAAATGVAAVVARDMNHFGAASYYATMASDRGMIGVVMGNVTASMAPTGGASAVVGNNPIAFAFPCAGAGPIVFDAATSRSSWGALLRAAQREEPLQPGAFRGPDGLPSTDPDVVLKGGSLEPIEGYKGYGLALCIGLLTGVLGGGRFDSEIGHPYRDLATPGHNSALVLAIAVDRFVEADLFAQRVDALGETIRSGPAADGADPIMMPGDREHRVAQRQGDAVGLEAATVAEIDALAHELGLAGRCAGSPA